jgi:hypothetical protein
MDGRAIPEREFGDPSPYAGATDLVVRRYERPGVPAIQRADRA